MLLYATNKIITYIWSKLCLGATESLLKMMKNAFYVTLKALFFLKIFKFLSWYFGHVEKRVDLKDKVNFNQLRISINTSRSNQTMKFG